MKLLWRFFRRLHNSVARRQDDARMREEIEEHLALQTADNVRRGLPPGEARRQAVLKFGAVESIKEDYSAERRVLFIEAILQDLRFALRMLAKSPGFTAIAILTLALGIGANTAIFSLINAIVLKSLPISHPENLVVLASFSQGGRVGDFGYPDYQTVRDKNRSLSGVLAVSSLAQINVGLGPQSEVANRKIVSSNYFSVLGVQPALGRAFNGADENLQVAVISNGFWKRTFAGSPSVIGKQIDLSGMPFTIAGVAPPGFFGETVGEAPDIWATMSLKPDRMNLPGFTWLHLMGRLKPGVQAQQASADLVLLLPQLQDSVSRGGFIDRIAVEAGRRGGSGLRDTFSTPLGILMAVVIVVLLIACLNLASLQLARVVTRQKEIATRLALGASRGRILRQLVTESVMLALFGGALGVLFSLWSERYLLSLVAGVGRSITVTVRPDMSVLAFTGMISIATGIAFGIMPALQGLRQGVHSNLTPNSHAFVDRQRRLSSKDSLIGLQIALSLLLLVVGGLFIRTIRNLKTQDLGFYAPNVLSVQIGTQLEYRPMWANVSRALLQRVKAIPGVQSATVSSNEILANDGDGVSGIKFDGYQSTREDQRVGANWVGSHFFETSGISLIEGRDFSPTDTSNSPRVAILNQTLARRYFDKGSAVGKRFQFNKKQYEIIGVVKDAKYLDLRQSNVPFMYFAALQENAEIHSLELRTTKSPLSIAGAVRDAIREVDPELRIGEVTTLEDRIDQKLAPEFLVSDIAGFFGGLTLFLVFIGIYGTLAYTVARRTNEIGIRMALGARKTDVLRLVLGREMVLTLLGIGVGIAGAMGLSHFLSSLLYGVKPIDSITFSVSSLILLAIAALASYIPARRAMRVDPIVALRYE